MVTRKFVSYLFEISNEKFCSLTFLPHIVYFGGKMEFIFAKTIFMDKNRTIGQKFLVKVLFLFIWALKRCAKFYLNPIILSKVIVSTDAGQRNRQTLS